MKRGRGGMGAFESRPWECRPDRQQEGDAVTQVCPACRPMGSQAFPEDALGGMGDISCVMGHPPDPGHTTTGTMAPARGTMTGPHVDIRSLAPGPPLVGEERVIQRVRAPGEITAGQRFRCYVEVRLESPGGDASRSRMGLIMPPVASCTGGISCTGTGVAVERSPTGVRHEDCIAGNTASRA